MWEVVKNVVIVSDLYTIPAVEIKKSVETGSKYRIVKVIDVVTEKSGVTGYREAGKRVMSELPKASSLNSIVIFCTDNGAWVQRTCLTSANKGYRPFHLLEPEIISSLPHNATSNIKEFLKLLGLEISGFLKAAEYTKEIRESQGW